MWKERFKTGCFLSIYIKGNDGQKAKESLVLEKGN